MRAKLIGLPATTLLVGGSAQAGEDASANCPMHHEQAGSAEAGAVSGEAHAAAVDRRGDVGMGFSHEKTTHHFGLTQSGGFISAEAKESDDLSSRDEIRAHFQHIAQAFSSGDFDLPMFIHGRQLPGVATMKKLRKAINYRVEETDRGGRIVVQTSNAEALQAVHRFLRFQIEDHRTGDSVAVLGR